MVRRNGAKKKIYIDDSLDSQISFVIVFHICFMQCKNMLVSTSFLYQYNSWFNIAAMFMVAFLYIRLAVRWRLLAHTPGKSVIVVVAIAIFWLCSYAADQKLFVLDIFPYNYVRDNAMSFISYGLPLFVAVSSLDNIDEFLERIYRVAPLTFFVATISFLFFILAPGEAVAGGYSMPYGNQVLLTTVMLFFRNLKKKSIWNFCMFILTIVYILVAGSRGPLVSIFALCIYWLMIKKKTRSVMFIAVVGTIFFSSVAFLRSQIFGLVNNILGKHNMMSRTLLLLENGNYAYDAGRSEFHDAVIKALGKSPFLGLGAFGWEKTVGLTHSLYLDIFANFGYVFGTLLMLLIIISIISCIRRNPESSCSTIIMMMSLIVFPRGFFDESFWETWELWTIMGILLGRCVYKNKVVTIGCPLIK